MTKKQRSTAPAYAFEISGNFLIELNDRLILTADNNWHILKKQARAEFEAFLGKQDIKHFRKHFSGCLNDVGTLLRKTNFLVDTPTNDTYYCINHQAFLHYREKVELTKRWRDIFSTNAIGSSIAHRLPDDRKFHCTKPLPRYVLPQEIQSIVKKKIDNEQLCGISEDFKDYFNNGNVFTQKNYYGAMNVLLQLEDADIIRKYRCLIQRNTQLVRSGNLYTLSWKQPRLYCFNDRLFSAYNRVLIIAENDATKKFANKSSLFEFLMSDKQTFTIPGEIVEPTFDGYVQSYSNRKLTIACTTALRTVVPYMLIFQPGRLTLRYQYHALKLVTSASSQLVTRLLFPKIINLCHAPALSLNWITPGIGNNKEQMDAVMSIVDQTPKNAPFVLFGPPGTGKTNILVEAILQLYLHQPDTKILVTAAPNSACDEIALRVCRLLSLHEEPRDKIIVRVYSTSQEDRRENIDKLVLEYSNMYHWQFFPNVGTLHQYRIVICTLSMVGKLMTGDFGVDVNGDSIFTHIFIDEVAAAAEAEALVGIANICQAQNSPAHLILSGDHMQLGPLLNSVHAKEAGLGVSLLERLLKRECYQVDEAGQYNRRIQARLCCNFRSHPSIVNLYSKLYYNNQLKAMAHTDVTSLCNKWSRLPNPNYPILFHSVFGKCQQDTEEGSFYNEMELRVVLEYVMELMSDGMPDRKITQEDIGVISPYKSQYKYIQQQLSAHHIYNIETGSVEIYRGKEKSIIILSCVRTDRLGFLKDPKRINTMLSRAKSLLILIGDPRLLSKNEDYKRIILECQSKGTFVGREFTIPEDKAEKDADAEIDAIISSLDAVMTSGQNAKKKTETTENSK